MDKEQELDLNALNAAARAMEPLAFRDSSDSDGEWEAEFVAEGRAQAIGRAEAAIKAYLAACRDEQRTEVVGWQPGERELARRWAMRLCTTLNTHPDHADDCQWLERLSHLLASPSPAVATGGVTEEQVEAAMSAYWGFTPGKSRTARDRMVEALTSALTVRDEGMREGWQPHDGRADPPIDGDTQVQVRFRDGDTRFSAMHNWDENWQWFGSGEPHPGDIVAYRVVPTPILKGEGE